MLWPAVSPLVLTGNEHAASGLHNLATEGSPWLIQKDLSRHAGSLPCDEVAHCYQLQSGAVVFSDLSLQKVDTYSAAYFNTFDRLFPVLDVDHFMDKVVARLLTQDYREDDPEGVLALFVFALGHLANDGVLRHPTRTVSEGYIEFRGDTIGRPSGLTLFNEARRRLGLIATLCCLENAQILLLEATSFEACARHLDFWSSVSAACTSCIFLVQSKVIDWSSQYGDLVKRAFWICLLHERTFNLEFGVAITRIEAMADSIPSPHFPKPGSGTISAISVQIQCTGLRNPSVNW